MSEVRLSIGGRTYTIACADGQEDHVAGLGGLVDSKLAEFGPNRAPQEAQNLLFAALLIAEDLHQARSSAADQQAEVAAAVRERNVAMGQHDQHKARIAELEQELANLQSAAQAAARDSDGIKAELTRLRAELVDAEQVESELRAGLAGLVEERDALQMELDEALSREAAVPQAHQHAMDGPFASIAAAEADAGLAPALERFAELLENCADKLEGKVQAP